MAGKTRLLDPSMYDITHTIIVRGGSGKDGGMRRGGDSTVSGANADMVSCAGGARCGESPLLLVQVFGRCADGLRKGIVRWGDKAGCHTGLLRWGTLLLLLVVVLANRPDVRKMEVGRSVVLGRRAVGCHKVSSSGCTTAPKRIFRDAAARRCRILAVMR